MSAGDASDVAALPWLTSLAASCLEVPEVELDKGVPLARYGLDSLASAALAAGISARVLRPVPESLLSDCPTLAALAKRLAHLDPGQSPPDGGPPVALMRADSVLARDIDPATAQPRSRMRAALVTGATGFLGARLVHALLRDTTLSVFCIARAASDAQARLRVARALDRCAPLSLDSRVHAVAGDLQERNLGLSTAAFDALSRQIDVVYHCAAEVNWVLPYEALRPTNVDGTREMLRLAARFRRKAFHLVSSLSVCYSTCGPAAVSERDDMLAWCEGIHLGYAQSKCVAEALARSAAERGLPVSIYRPALLCGEAGNGAFNREDLLSRLFKGCIEMGQAPDLDWMADCCPVDFVAESIVRLSQRRPARLNVYHLANPRPRRWSEAVLWMNLFGYPVQMVPLAVWLERLEQACDASASALHPLRPFFLRRPAGCGGRRLPELYDESFRRRIDCRRSRRALARLAVSCPALDPGLLERLFRAYIQSGYLPPPRQVLARPKSRFAGPAEAQALAAALRQHFEDRSLEVCRNVPRAQPVSSSIVGELASWRYGSRAGIRVRTVKLRTTGGERSLDVLLKSRPRDEQLISIAQQVAAACSPSLGLAFARHADGLGLRGCHLRELAVYAQRDNRFHRHAPVCYGAWTDERAETWTVALERLRHVELMDSANDLSGWHPRHIEAALEGIAEFHAIWLGREPQLLAQPWIGRVHSAASILQMRPLWQALAEHAHQYFTRWVPEIAAVQQELVERASEWWPRLEACPRTLIHNDFNPRNLAFRNHAGKPRLCAYDWELATLGVPQRDLAELLCFVLRPGGPSGTAVHYVEVHRRALERASARTLDRTAWHAGFRLALCDFALARLPMYTLVHTFQPQPFLERVVRTWWTLYRAFPGLSEPRHATEAEAGPQVGR